MIGFFKRSIDLVLLATLSPVFLVLFLLIYCLLISKKNPIFKQKRIGFKEKEFTIYKFKTIEDEKVINAFCLFLRKSNLDEIPQLLNVLKGEMSWIGPRPLLPEYLPKYTLEQRKRHLVRPGLTGWAQVNGANSLNWKDRLEKDVYYADNQSFVLDFKIFFLTFLLPFKKEDNNHFSEKFEG